MRPQSFSDTKVVYEVKLTKEPFNYKMSKLANDMMQDAFENFI